MMRGERIFAPAAEEVGDASDMTQMTAAFIGMMERFRSIENNRCSGAWLQPSCSSARAAARVIQFTA
jgi:hypothetical protein